MDYQIFTLNNGIRVIHQPTDSPVAHFGVIINAGSRDEEENEQGIAHFIEHTIFKGTAKRKAFQVINCLEDVGGELNAYTTKEETAIYATFLKEYYPRAVELISDILYNASFPQKEIELEKEVIVEEINSYNDSPSELIFDEFEELIYNSHPIARNILGTPDSVRSFDKSMIDLFMMRNYHANRMVICSVGNISPQKFLKLIESNFDKESKGVTTRNRIDVNPYIPQNKEVEKNTFQSHCIIGAEAYSFSSKLRLPMILMNNILGGNSMNSRLNMALRERNGMAYNVESSYTPYTDTGVFMVYFGTDRVNLTKAAAIIEREFKLLREKKMGEIQLKKAKMQLIGQLAISSENREDLMLNLGRSLLYFDKVDSLNSVFEKIEAITPDEIFQVANEMLEKNRLSKLIFY